MDAEQIIDKLAEAVSARLIPSIKPAIPIEIALWNVKDIGAYIKCDPNKVVERYASLKDFPKAIRLPTAENRTKHPMWRARDVVRWVDGYAG